MSSPFCQSLTGAAGAKKGKYSRRTMGVKRGNGETENRANTEGVKGKWGERDTTVG